MYDCHTRRSCIKSPPRVRHCEGEARSNLPLPGERCSVAFAFLQGDEMPKRGRLLGFAHNDEYTVSKQKLMHHSGAHQEFRNVGQASVPNAAWFLNHPLSSFNSYLGRRFALPQAAMLPGLWPCLFPSENYAALGLCAGYNQAVKK